MIRAVLGRLRMRSLEAESDALTGNRGGVVQHLSAMRVEVLNIPSTYGKFRQLFDNALRDVESWNDAADLAAVASSTDQLRALLTSLEEASEAPHGDSAA